MKKTPRKKVTSKKPFGDFYTSDDMKRHMGALAENFGDKVSAVAEQIVGIHDKIDEVDSRLSTKLDTQSEMIGRLLLDMEEVKSGLRQKIDREEFTKLEKRMVALESYVFTGKARGITKR